MIAYFRHSIKATGKVDYSDKLAPSDESGPLIDACRSVNNPVGDPANGACLQRMEQHFEAYQGQLTGNGKQKCPVSIGKMLRARVRSKQGKPVRHDLWTGSYERVLGTGMQTSAGFDGQEGVPKEDMPNANRDVAPEAWSPITQAGRSSPKEFLLTHLRELDARRSGWLKEYIFDYSAGQEVSGEACKRLGATGHFSVESEGWGKGESGGCELSVYSATAKQKGNDCISESSFRDEINGWSSSMRDIYARTDFDMIRGLQRIATDQAKRFEFLLPYVGPCRNYDYAYANGVCKVGQHFFNERVSGIEHADHKAIIPICDEDSDVHSDEACDKVIDMLNDLCWPYFTKSHIIGHNAHFVDNSAALVVGALAMRSRRPSAALKKAYLAMLKSAGSKDYPGRDESLVDNNGHILMSSHDATTNGLRLIMLDAGLKPRAINKWSDGSLMQFQDELAYQVMLTFDWHENTQMIKVSNLVTSLGTTRRGCRVYPNDMQELGRWDQREFLTKMTKFLLSRNSAKQHRVDPAVMTFLRTLVNSYPLVLEQ